MRILVLLAFAAACGGKSSAARAICERAASRWQSCVGELLGEEAKAYVAGKDGTAECARDAKTVAMYRACLPVEECGAFLDCLEGEVAKEATPIPADLPRREQCEAHVADGLRGIAFQETRTESARDCVLDESRAWESCVDADVRAIVAQYGAQRQRECEAWPPELAACILGLPGATGCDPDSYPFWRLPLAEGPAGPPVAWSTEVADDEDYEDDVDFVWTADRTLIVRDDTGLRALRDGAVRWQAPLEDAEVELALAGGWIALDAGDDRGVVLHEVATGARATALAGEYVERIGAAGDRFLVRIGGGTLHEVTPARCRRGACAKALGELDSDDLSSADAIGAWQGGVVMVSTEGVQVLDRKLATRATIGFSADDALLTPDSVLVADSQGIAILSLAGCAVPGSELELESTQDRLPGDCVAARRQGGWIDRIAAVPGGVAWNDDSLTEETHYLGRDGRTWEVRTAASGGVAGDDRHVYAVSLGFDAAGPVRLLALARATGEIAWQTTLAAKPPADLTVQVAAGQGAVAAQVGPTLYVVAAEP